MNFVNAIAYHFSVLKRRLIFDPLPEPEPLQTGNRADLPSSGAPVVPPVTPEVPVVAGASG